MGSSLKVGDVMTRNYVSVKPDTSLYECSKVMVKNKVGSLLVKHENKMHGIITEKDIIAAIVRRKNSDLTKIQARDIAAKKLITVKPEDDILIALDKMRKSYHKRLPVVANGSIVGFLTIKDILRIQPELFAEVSDSFKIREEIDKMKKVSGIRGVKLSGEGRCEECGEMALLYKSDGALLCEQCAGGLGEQNPLNT